MAFEQFKLDIATHQTRGIFNTYVYETTTDTIAEVSAVGYFVASRFELIDDDGSSALFLCKCSDGFFQGFTDVSGTITPTIPNGGPYLKTESPDTQNVASDVVFAGTITASEGVFGPASVIVGSNKQDQAGTFLTITSGLPGTNDLGDSTVFILCREYDEVNGSLNIISSRLAPLGLIALAPLTGTPLQITDGLKATGASAPAGVDGYQSVLGLFTYDEMVNLSISTAINNFEDEGGVKVATVKDFSSGTIDYFPITNISQSNPVVVTAPGHNFVDGDRHAVRGITTGMTEINNKVDGVANVIAGVSFEMPNIDSTLFTSYTSGGETGGRVVKIPLDNLLRVSEFQDYFTIFRVESPFFVDAAEIAPSVLIPYVEIIGFNILENEILITSTEDGLVAIKDLHVTGNALVDGTLTAINTQNLNIKDAYIYQNNGYISLVSTTGGTVINYGAVGASDTVTNGDFTAGINLTSNPTIITDGSDTFTTGDIIQISNTNLSVNDGVFEVLDHVGTLLTIRGVGLTDTVEPFTQNQLETGNDSAIIEHINAGIIRIGDSGNIERGKGNVTGIVYTHVVSGIETLLTGISLATSQEPSGTGIANAINIEFGAAQGTGGDPVQIDVNGQVTINETGLYRISISFQFGRTGTPGVSELLFRLLIDGSQTGTSIGAKVINTATLDYASVDNWFNFTAGQTLDAQVMRDSAGNDSGGLFQTLPTDEGAGTWNDVPSAIIKIERWV